MRNQGLKIFLCISFLAIVGCEVETDHEKLAKSYSLTEEKLILSGRRKIEIIGPDLREKAYYLAETNLNFPGSYGSYAELWFPFGSSVPEDSFLWVYVFGRISHYNKNGELISQVNDTRHRDTNCQYLLVSDPTIEDDQIECSYLDEDNNLQWRSFSYATAPFFERSSMYAHKIKASYSMQKFVYAQLVGYKARGKKQCLTSGSIDPEIQGQIQYLDSGIELTQLSSIEKVDLNTDDFYEYWDLTYENYETVIYSDAEKPLTYFKCRNK
jgi:hypothetical protein